MSLGPRRIIVPAVEGTSLRSARLALEQAQVPIGRVVEVDDPAEEGTILVQHPPAGEAGSALEGVSLLVSRGPRNADYLMPDLIGRQADLVLDRLRAAGLKVAEVRYRTYPGVAPGHRPAPDPPRRAPGEHQGRGQPRHQQGRVVILLPSILAADFGRLAEEIARAERGGAGAIHADVMDGHFVPNLTLGPAVVKAVRRATSLPIDVHLMIEEPDRFVDAFIDAGASWISIHVETTPHLQRTVAHLRARGMRPGVVLNPATPLSTLDEILDEVDYVLLMSVNPGFGGQAFLPASLGKVRRLRRIVQERGLRVQIEVDGGVDQDNARSLVDAGAELLVAGSAVFGTGDPEAAARKLLESGR